MDDSSQHSESGGGPTTPDSERAQDDPRNISGQNEEHSAAARGAEVELTPEEREDQVKSAAPDGGEIQELPDQPAKEDEKSSSRVSVVDESAAATGPARRRQ